MRFLKLATATLLATSLYASSTSSDCVCFKLEGEMGAELKALIEKYHGELAHIKSDSTSSEAKGISLFTVTEKKAITKAELTEVGKNLYTNRCAVCHGDSGQKRAYGKSRALNSLSNDDIVQAIRGYKGGTYDRGMGFLMSPFSNISEEEVQGVYEYLQTLK
ncbi:c-type cytochrome [Arcobacter sp. FWKO B]|uniref:c-type cytochrome n=1 Tax=Arcobacter sp. FWKO B TaxID=2593672 RepID=UPI0018A614B8|nr:cytochrome c [Arcobacter sp. FWKO B]QOG12564.1 cytochrome c [Arcobacter sp. FWKO B]